jgi:hypothetical protein
MGPVTLTFRQLIEFVEHSIRVKPGGHRYDGSRDKRGQSFDFDLEYLGNYDKVKVKVKRKL